MLGSLDLKSHHTPIRIPERRGISNIVSRVNIIMSRRRTAVADDDDDDDLVMTDLKEVEEAGDNDGDLEMIDAEEPSTRKSERSRMKGSGKENEKPKATETGSKSSLDGRMFMVAVESRLLSLPVAWLRGLESIQKANCCYSI